MKLKKDTEIPNVIKKRRHESSLRMNFDTELKLACQVAAHELGITLTEFIEHAAIRQLSEYAPVTAEKIYKELK